MPDRDWMVKAACREHDWDQFFPRSQQQTTAIAAAQAVCRTCPVISECAKYAKEIDAHHGVWAGEFLNRRDYRSPNLQQAEKRERCRKHEPVRIMQSASGIIPMPGLRDDPA